MKRTWQIGLMALAGIGLGTWAKLRSTIKVPCDCTGEPAVQKVVDGSEDSYTSADLKRWGTKQGIIDVASKTLEKKKKRKALKQMSSQGKVLSSAYLAAKKEQFLQQGKAAEGTDALLKHLQEEVFRTQVILTNHSEDSREVTLWEANRDTPLSAPLASDVADHELLSSWQWQDLVHPQGMAYNPNNELTYITYQLSDVVQVISSEGQTVKTIALSAVHFPGLISPVAVAINTKTESPYYGYAYVVGSVSNTLHVINTEMEVVATVAVGNRPLAIAYCALEDQLWITNHSDHTVSVVDAATLEVTLKYVGMHPLGITVNSTTASAYVAHQGGISCIDAQGERNEVALQDPARNVAYHEQADQLYVVSTTSIHILETETLTVIRPIDIGQNAYAIQYHPNNHLIYVGCRHTGTLHVLDTEGRILTTLTLDGLYNGLAVDTTLDRVWTSDSASGCIHQVGYSNTTQAVTVDTGYLEKSRSFQHNPALVKDAKLVFSDNNVTSLRVRTGGATGNSQVQTLSLRSYQSPQHFLPVAQVQGLTGALIDGANGWSLTLAPKQTVTLLVSYQQVDRYALLPEKTPHAIGVSLHSNPKIFNTL